MTDDLIKRLRHSDARYLADRCHIHAEAADALEAAENAKHTAQRQRDIWEKVAETQGARIAELEAGLAAARAELLEAADKFHVFYCNASQTNPDKPFMKKLADRMSAAARGEKTDTHPPTLDRDLIPDGDVFMLEWGRMCGPAADFKAAEMLRHPFREGEDQ